MKSDNSHETHETVFSSFESASHLLSAYPPKKAAKKRYRKQKDKKRRGKKTSKTDNKDFGNDILSQAKCKQEESRVVPSDVNNPTAQHNQSYNDHSTCAFVASHKVSGHRMSQHTRSRWSEGLFANWSWKWGNEMK